jgi:hypothetical protein
MLLIQFRDTLRLRQHTFGGRSVEYQVIVLRLSKLGQFRLIVLGPGESQVKPSAYASAHTYRSL